jgi:hypothetical protein
MARMPKISKENLDKFRVVRDEHTRKYLETVPSAVLATAGLYMDAATGKWLFKGAKSAFPKVLQMLRKGGTSSAVKAVTPRANRYQNTKVKEWDAESASFKPEPMKPKRSPGRTTGTVPKVKKRQEAVSHKEKLKKRKNKRGM